MKRFFLAALLAATALPATAQQTLSDEARSAAVSAIAAAFEHDYVFPEMRPLIVERLRQGERSGRYAVTDPVVLADRITEDLRAVSKDRHLSLKLDAAAYAAAIAPAKDGGEERYYTDRATRDHHGLTELRILDGNIRYLRISGFEWIEDRTGSAYDDAMRFLKDGDAIIIDVRDNGGGSHGAVRYLASHFMDPETLELTFLAGAEPPVQSRALDHLPAGRLKGKPLYVLINGRTASAAEAFAYDVQQFRLGELVGATTVGAANNNRLLPIAPDFILSLSYGRPVHAVSGTNWEGSGIAPDIAASSAEALDVAQARALHRLTAAPGVSAERRRDYEWALTGVAARLHPAPRTGPAMPGRYGAAGGTIAVERRDGALWITMPRNGPARLLPLTGDWFAVDGYQKLRVRLSGTALDLQWRDEAAPRRFVRE